jgi:glycosyltransferase involved in cell wall biosynthesis
MGINPYSQMAEGKHIANDRKVRVLYLSHDGLTDPLGQSQILPYLCGIAGAGYSITIISFEKPERFDSAKREVSAICKAHEIDWIPLKYHNNPPIFSTLLDLFKLRLHALKLHKRKQFSIVHCRSYITALVGLWLKRNYALKFIFDTRGFWVEERVEGGLWNLGNPLYKLAYRFFKNKEKDFIREANSVIVLTDAAKKEIESWNLNKNIAVVPCCADLKKFDASRFNLSDRYKVRKELNIGADDYVLLYLGSLGTWYLYSDMIAYFRLVKEKIPNAKFLFITQDINRVDDDPDFIARTVFRNDIPKYIFACDAAVCFIKPSFSKKGSSATKMAEVLAMRLPMVTNPGWGDVEYLKQRINNLYVFNNNFEEIMAKMSSAQWVQHHDDFFSNYFSLEKGIQQYTTVYGALASGIKRDLLTVGEKSR